METGRNKPGMRIRFSESESKVLGFRFLGEEGKLIWTLTTVNKS